MNPHWNAAQLPSMRHEYLYGDRVVRCFADRPASLLELLARSAARQPDAEALVFKDLRWSYAALQAAVERAAAGLATRGVSAGERVLIYMGNRAEFVVALFAVQRLGAVAVPVGEREQMPGLAYIAQQCGASAIVFEAALADRVPPAAEAPALALRVSVGAANGAVPFDTLGADGAAPPPLPAVDAGDVAVILYTSGTTGRPKGAMLTHLNIVHSALHYEVCMGLRAGERSALAVPASHVTGLIAIIAATLHVGGAVVIVPEFKAPVFLSLLAAERVSFTLMVPAMYQLCLMNPAFADTDLSSWRIGAYGGAPMPVSAIDALARQLPGLMLLNAYGATETTSPATMMPAGQTREHADTVGVALPCADIRVMDDDGRELPVGETGELWIGGPMVVPGYWNNPEATAANFAAGFWRSGDVGSVDADGFVRLSDRKKDMLNRGGFKIYSVEVEHTIMAIPGVVEAAIVGKPCPVLGERVHAFVYAPSIPHDTEQVRAHCASQLTDYKVPETVTWVEQPLPRNAGGKLLKRALRDTLTA